MALNVAVGSLTLDTTGNKTISLASNFDPKAIVMFGIPTTTTDTTSQGNYHSMGVATYRGSSVQQFCAGFVGEAGDQTAQHNASWQRNDALFWNPLADVDVSVTVDAEVDLVSMQTGATSEVVVNVVNVHTTANIVVQYMILGGSDITDAIACEFAHAAASANKDLDLSGVTGGTGWTGKPKAGLIVDPWGTITGGGANQMGRQSIGWFNDTVEQAVCFVTNGSDANATADFNVYQRMDRVGRTNSAPTTVDAEYHVDTTTANWPANGVRFVYDDQAASASDEIIGLFLQGTFQSKIAQTNCATTANGTADVSCGFTPVGAMLWGSCLAAATTQTSTGTDLGCLTIGAWDGTNERSVLVMDDDANANQRSRMRWSNTKGYMMRSMTGTTENALGECDVSVSGTSVRTTWTTAPASALAFLTMAFGSAAAAGSTTPKQLAALGVG